MDAATLTGHQKIAVLCMSLGSDAAAEITRRMPVSDAEAVATEIAQMETVPPALTQQVLAEWESKQAEARSVAGGGPEYARELLQKTFDSSKAAAVLSRLDDQGPNRAARFGLAGADPRQLVNLLQHENPQAVALVLSFLDEDAAASVLEKIGTDAATDVVHRMAKMESVSPQVLEIVAESMRAGSRVFVSGDLSEAGGMKTVAAVMNRMGDGADEQIFNALNQRDPSVFEGIRQLMFVFEDLNNLDKKSLQKLLQNVESKQLALSLKVASDGVREKIEGVMSQRALSSLKTEMDFLGAVRASEVEEAQSLVIEAARALEAQGEIVLSTGESDDFIE